MRRRSSVPGPSCGTEISAQKSDPMPIDFYSRDVLRPNFAQTFTQNAWTKRRQSGILSAATSAAEPR